MDLRKRQVRIGRFVELGGVIELLVIDDFVNGIMCQGFVEFDEYVVI